MVMERGYMVERRVGTKVECGRTIRSRVVIGVPLGIVVGGSLLGMARCDVWRGRLVLRGIVRMDLG